MLVQTRTLVKRQHLSSHFDRWMALSGITLEPFWTLLEFPRVRRDRTRMIRYSCRTTEHSCVSCAWTVARDRQCVTRLSCGALASMLRHGVSPRALVTVLQQGTQGWCGLRTVKFCCLRTKWHPQTEICCCTGTKLAMDWFGSHIASATGTMLWNPIAVSILHRQ